MSNPEAGRNPDLITGPIIGSKSLFAAAEGARFKGFCPGGDDSVSRSSLINASQNVKFYTKFPTLNKDFSEMRKFQAKPLKLRCDICLKTPNPEGFWITPKSRKVRGDASQA